MEVSTTNVSPEDIDLEQRFRRSITAIAVTVPKGETSKFVSKLKSHFVRLPRLRPVVVDPKDEDQRLLLLDPETAGEDLSLISPKLKELVDSTPHVKVDRNYTVETTYLNYGVEDVLRDIMPSDVDVPSSYELAGHIAHLNLRTNQIPYKKLIGRVLIDKLPMIRTVVNKVGTISSTYRTFDMELLAGEDEYNTEVKEGQCRFQFNFKQVYWNSRLQMEHGRLVSTFARGEVICDMFAGVGPFALPAAKMKGCVVHANDLNPKSYEHLKKNAKLNKLESLVHCYNLDGREFIHRLVASHTAFSHVIMNLPASAEAFLDVFRSVPHDLFGPGQTPHIHCYMFTSAEDPKQDVIERAQVFLGKKILHAHVHRVRDVSPKKWMMCLSFPLFPREEEVEEAEEFAAIIDESSSRKRRRTDGELMEESST